MLFLLVACIDNSKLPVGSLVYTVEITGTTDECHPTSTEGYQETLEFGVFFDASSADVYADGQPFGAGTQSGCNLTYQSVVIGTDERAGGDLKWQLTGSARIETDASGDQCVEGEGEWEGTETITIISSDDEAIESGCTYTQTTLGEYVETVE